MDLGPLKWINPTTLLPLVLFMREQRELPYIPPYSSSVANYIHTVMTRPESAVGPYSSYIPVADLPSDQKDGNNILKGHLIFIKMVWDMVERMHSST